MSSRSLLVSCCVIAVLVAAPVFAADSDGEYTWQEPFQPEDMLLESGLFGGVFIPSSEHELYDDSVTDQQPFKSVLGDFGLRVGFWPLKYVGIELEGAAMPGKTESDDFALVYAMRGHLMGQFPWVVTPFAVVGAGFLNIRSDDDVLGDDFDTAGYWGVGAKYFPWKLLAVRLDFRQNLAPKVDSHQGITSHFEVLLGVSYAFRFKRQEPQKVVEPPKPVPVDTDGDGIFDPDDGCVDEPEDVDQFEDTDGCPDLDNDADSILDTDDLCPLDAEVVNGVDDEDGCPDEVGDTDGDGILDNVDKCPSIPEDKDGLGDEDGCPEEDHDSDGLADEKDACPAEAGVVKNVGCPASDKDKDGIMDRLDNCPRKAGPAKNEGCPRKQLVKISEKGIELKDKVYFERNRARIKKKSNKLLNNVVQVLVAHPEVTKVRIGGHTDDTGEKAFNKRLSEDRAKAVMNYLIKAGIDTGRLEAVGYGDEMPVAPNRSKRGRAQNRRVEFQILSE